MGEAPRPRGEGRSRRGERPSFVQAGVRQPSAVCARAWEDYIQVNRAFAPDMLIIPVGSTVDLLLDLSNPGTWMLHCHIGEHIESGMMAAIKVDAS